MATILARAPQDDVVRGDHVPAAVRDTLDRRLERRVLERLDLPAIVADEVVMVVPVRVRRLETGDAVPEVDPLHEPEFVHPVERAIDARYADA